MRTAGSEVLMMGSIGKISSRTNHLSQCSNNFPKHTKQLTRTLTEEEQNQQKMLVIAHKTRCVWENGQMSCDINTARGITKKMHD